MFQLFFDGSEINTEITMTKLVSPEHDLGAFCKSVAGSDPSALVNAISAEIVLARHLHCVTAKKADFPKGSKGREYCENLQRLLWMLMNGSVPDGSTPEFLWTVKPLVQQLLQKWEIGNLRQVFAKLPRPGGLSLLDLPETADPVVFVVSRDEVEAGDTSVVLGHLRRLVESREVARDYVERVDIAFHGYDDVGWELPEIPAVRDFANQLDDQFPFWLFFLSKRHLGLQCLLHCFLPPFLTDEGRAKHHPPIVDRLLVGRWFPAMNQICEYVGYTEEQIERLSERALAYFTAGPFPLDSERFA